MLFFFLIFTYVDNFTLKLFIRFTHITIAPINHSLYFLMNIEHWNLKHSASFLLQTTSSSIYPPKLHLSQITTILLYSSDSNNHRLVLGDSAMLAAAGKAGLKPQGTISSAKQLRVDQKK